MPAADQVQPVQLIYSLVPSRETLNPLRLSTFERRAMHPSKLEVADVFYDYCAIYQEKYGASMSSAQRRVMSANRVVSNGGLGGHLERRDGCGHEGGL